MDINYFENNIHTEITKEFTNIKEFKIIHPSVIKISHLEVDADLDWNKTFFNLTVNGVINFSLLFLNEFTNQEEEYVSSINWNEEYCFSSNESSNSNIILGDEFNIVNYAIEQININLPYNFINNSDIIKKVCSNDVFFTEEEYNKKEQNKLDPRWECLDQFNKNK